MATITDFIRLLEILLDGIYDIACLANNKVSFKTDKVWQLAYNLKI